MPPKGIDYSKWDKIECSSSDDEQDKTRNDNYYDEDDEEYYEDEQQQVLPPQPTTFKTHQLSTNNTEVRQYNSPTSITFGGGGGNTTATSSAISKNNNTTSTSSKHQQKEVEVTVREPLAAVRQDDAAIGISKNTTTNINNNKKTPKYLRNGSLIVNNINQQLNSSSSSSSTGYQGLFWTQSADNVTVGIILENFTMLDFLEITDDKNNRHEDLGIDEALRKWSQNKSARVKVTKVDVFSSSPNISNNNDNDNDDDDAASMENNSNNNSSCCNLKVSIISASSSFKPQEFSLQLAYDARPVDPDTLWNIEILSSSELPGLNKADDHDDNNDEEQIGRGNLRPETILASRCLIIELKKMLPGDFNPFAKNNNNDHQHYESQQEEEARLRQQQQLITSSSGLKFWWSKLLSNGLGKIDVEKDIEDRKGSQGQGGGSSSSSASSKQEQIKQAWDEAHRMFREKIAARKAKEAKMMHEMLKNEDD